MVRLQQLNTRIDPEAYKLLMMKCADQGCSTYKYLQQLVHADVGIDVEAAAVQESGVQEAPGPVQTELKAENESDERRFEFRG